MSRFLLFRPYEARYETVSLFVERCAQALELQGDDAQIIHFGKPEVTEKSVRELLQEEIDGIIAFSFFPSLKEEGELIYDQLDLPILFYLIDHPLYNMRKLSKPFAHLQVACVDRTHVASMPQLFGGYEDALFWPHASAFLETPEILEPTIPVLFAGTHISERELEKDRIGWPKVMQKVIEEMVAIALEGHNTPFLELFFEVLKGKGLTYTPKLLPLARSVFIAWDQEVRHKRRLQVLQTLDNEGISVDVYGKGWEKASFCHHHLHPEIPFNQLLELMRLAEVVLHIGPNFSDGSHERVFSALHAGAAVVADQNPYWVETFGNQIGFYHFTHLENLAEQIHQSKGERGKMQKEIEERHTWTVRVQNLRKKLRWCL